jgi:hypothetical protein
LQPGARFFEQSARIVKRAEDVDVLLVGAFEGGMNALLPGCEDQLSIRFAADLSHRSPRARGIDVFDADAQARRECRCCGTNPIR